MADTPAPKKLTARRQKFVDVYDGNGTEACRKAGFKGTDATLAQTAYELLRIPEVAEAIRARNAAVVGPLIANRQARQAFWSSVMGGVAEVMLLDGTKATMPVEMKDRLKASELLGRSEADFTDKLAGADGGPLQVVVNVLGPNEEDDNE